MTTLYQRWYRVIAVFVGCALVTGMAFVFAPSSAQAAKVVEDKGSNSSLGELIVLDSLFSGSFMNDSSTDTTNGLLGTSRLGELIVLSQLFGNNNGLFNTTDGTSLGELLVLDNLFSGNVHVDTQNRFGFNGTSRLGELIVLSELFGNGNFNLNL